jgi:hypothetical protein
MSSASPSLVLAGRIEAIPLGDILQVLAEARRDGVLTIEREDPPERGEIELCNGRVVRAEIANLPETVGTMLVRRRQLDPDALGEALRLQSSARAFRPLASVLLEMGAIDPAPLAEAMLEEIGQNTSQLLAWERGVFRFRTHAGAGGRVFWPLAGVAVEARELLLLAAQRQDEAAAFN